MDQKQAVLGQMSLVEKSRLVWAVWRARARRKNRAPQAAWCAMVAGIVLSFALASRWGMVEFVAPEWSMLIGYPYAVGLGLFLLAAFGFSFLKGEDAAGAARRSFLGAVLGVALVGSVYGWSIAENRTEAVMKDVDAVASRAALIRAGCQAMEKSARGIRDSQMASWSSDVGRLARAASPKDRMHWIQEIERDRAELAVWDGKREEARAKCAQQLAAQSAASGLSDAAKRFKMDMVVEMWAMCAVGAIFAGLAAFARQGWAGAVGGAFDAGVWREIASAPRRGARACWRVFSAGARWCGRMPKMALGVAERWWFQALDEGLDGEAIARVEREKIRKAAGIAEGAGKAERASAVSRRL